MNAAQFESFVGQYEKLVYTVCWQLVRDRELAQDLSQETFLSAWRSIERCPEGHEAQWLARIAANKAKDHLRSAWNRRVSLSADGSTPGQDVPDTAPDPEALRKWSLALLAAMRASHWDSCPSGQRSMLRHAERKVS